jgi:hypothetical protein
MFVMTVAKGLERTWCSGADVFRETETLKLDDGVLLNIVGMRLCWTPR